MLDKYKFTGETKIIRGDDGNEHTVRRIVALKDFGNVRKGQKGGWLEEEKNLRQDGNCWVADDAIVYEESFVYDNALIKGHAVIKKKSSVWNNAIISSYAQIIESCVYDDAQVQDDAIIIMSSVIDKAIVCDRSKLENFGLVSDSCIICGNSYIANNSSISADGVFRDVHLINGERIRDISQIKTKS